LPPSPNPKPVVLNTKKREMIIEYLGYNSSLENHRKEHHLDSFGVGRVMSEHKERYFFKTAKNKFDVE
jgi:ribosome biogenesis GTPase